jgi:CheY-like chemotaxis protein
MAANPAEITIYLNKHVLTLFEQLCAQNNLNTNQAISNYILTCIKTKRLITQEELDQLNINEFIEKEIEASKAQVNNPINEQEKDNNAPVVMIVDDSRIVREMLNLSLSKDGYRVEKADDGQQAWDKLCGGLKCDLIVSDIEMPKLDGLALLSRIKQDSRFSKIPVVMLSFLSEDKYKQSATRSGATSYLVKPYEEPEFLDTIKRLLKKEILLPSSNGFSSPEKNDSNLRLTIPTVKENKLPPPRITTSTPINGKPIVMIIDDSIVVRQMVSMSFSKAGYQVEQARDGQEAWQRLNSGLSCNLIICDIEMPRLNGLEFLALVQKNPNLASIPIAMLTSRGAQKMKRIAAKRGAKAYLVKPYVEKNLIDTAQKLLAGEVLLELAPNDLN